MYRNPSDAPIRALLRDVGRLLRSWWLVDRIRISPCEGALLRLQPPCFLMIDGEPIEVLSREVAAGTDRPAVRFVCRSGTAEAKLEVSLDVETSTQEIFWSIRGCRRSIFEQQVEIYG